MNLETELPKDDPNATAMQSPGIFSAPNRVGLATNWNLIREFAIKFFTRKCLDFTKDLHISYKTESPLMCECTGEILNDLNDLETLEK